MVFGGDSTTHIDAEILNTLAISMDDFDVSACHYQDDQSL